MTTQLFRFSPAAYARDFARDGYVHIKSGATEEFYKKMALQVDEHIRTKPMKEFAVGDKQQAMYDFPDDSDYVQQLFRAVGGVCGFAPDDLVLSERHIKAYEASADPEPHAHKDRFASEISLGISVHVREGSTLILYPHDELEVNPFNASTLLRASLSPDRHPEPRLKKARRVEINDAPGDVVIFRGHKIWHLRANPAQTTMLYLKLNAMNCDPLGEDPRTVLFRKNTEAAAQLGDEQLERLIPMIGRRVDYMHKFYNRNWQEVSGVVLWGEHHFTIDEHEMKALRAVDGKRTVCAVLDTLNGALSRPEALKKVRRLALRGVIDLIRKATS